MIRTRVLTPDEVLAINSVLKSRSRQYLAAYEETWLFPKTTGLVAWKDIGKVLLPPSDMVWDFGGETYIGHKDGSTHYQARISDLAVVLYRQDQSPRLDFWGSDVREPYYGG